jgi:hypothetical protein
MTGLSLMNQLLSSRTLHLHPLPIHHEVPCRYPMTRLTRTSSSQLTLRSASIGTWFFALLFITVAVVAWLYRGGLACDRETGICTVGVSSLPGVTQQYIRLADILGAEVLMHEAEDGKTLSSVVLQTADGPVPLGAGRSSFHRINQRSVDRINDFLDDRSQPAIRVSTALAWAGLPFLLFGVGLILFGTRSYATVLDKEADRYRIRVKRPFRSVYEEGALSDITGTMEKHTGGSSTKPRAQLGLLDIGGAFHPITTRRRFGVPPFRRAAAEICTFLELGESAALSGWDLRPSLSEIAHSMRGAKVHEEEVEEMRARLAQHPDDVEGFRQLAIRLMRLDRRQEAGTILRDVHRRLAEQQKRPEANRMAGIIHALKI